MRFACPREVRKDGGVFPLFSLLAIAALIYGATGSGGTVSAFAWGYIALWGLATLARGAQAIGRERAVVAAAPAPATGDSEEDLDPEVRRLMRG